MPTQDIKIFLKSRKISGLDIFYDYNIRNLSTFRIKGTCQIFIIANSIDALLELLNVLHEKNVPYFIIGSGSNTIINDNCDDIIIKLGKSFDYIEYGNDGLISAGAACILGRFIINCYKNKYDFSFLAGIPGTIGGAVAGNCGSKLESICDYVDTIECIRILKNKAIKEKLKLNSSNYGYRFLKIERLCVITGINFRKEKAVKELIYINIRENIKLKKTVQPLNTFNCGCYFKNPLNSNKTSGELIDSLGLKGFSFGGAVVSEKHANFLENKGTATSMDIYSLAKVIAGLVYDNFNIKLENEVKSVGFTN